MMMVMMMMMMMIIIIILLALEVCTVWPAAEARHADSNVTAR